MPLPGSILRLAQDSPRTGFSRASLAAHSTHHGVATGAPAQHAAGEIGDVLNTGALQKDGSLRFL
jgi:hypothetical protein